MRDKKMKILETEEVKEYHSNSQRVAYFCTFQKVKVENDSEWRSLGNALVTDAKDEYKIRVGEAAKYFKNGQLAWKLNYDEKGNVIKGTFESFREDGSAIIFN